MGTTPIAGFPYPEPSDPVAAGADNIKALAQKLEPSAWTTPALPAGWTTPAGYQAMSYRTEQGGIVVVLRGTAQNPNAATGTITLFTLPVGMRPTASLIYAITTATMTGSGYATPRLSVVASGVVTLQYGSWSAPAPHSVSLDGVRVPIN